MATERIAVLEIDSSVVGPQERALLADAIRGGALTALSGRVKVMTRENMEVMMSDMGIDADCVAEGACEVETARNLGVDYVLSGSVAQVSGVFILGVKLHETRGGELLGSEQARSKDVLGLLDVAPVTAQKVLGPIGGRVVSDGGGGQVGGGDGGSKRPASAANTLGPIPQAYRGLDTTGALESDHLGSMVCIDSGTFVMGSNPDESDRYADEIRHRVSLSRGFCVMTNEVTIAQWEAVGLPARKIGRSCGDSCPVEGVTWLDAAQFANSASEREGLAPAYTISGVKVSRSPDANGYRLPTEAEWEAAARGQSEARWSGSNVTDSVAWTTANSAGSAHVGCELEVNVYGLCDMSGNVAEWVWDVYAVEKTDYAADPTGPKKGATRVVRGGSYLSDARDSRVSFRTLANQTATMPGVGLRLVRNAP